MHRIAVGFLTVSVRPSVTYVGTVSNSVARVIKLFHHLVGPLSSYVVVNVIAKCR